MRGLLMGMAGGLAVCVLGCGSPARNDRFDMTDAAPNDGTTASDTPVTGEHCARQSDCDDHFDCTDDTCVVGGVCQHETNDRMCPSGQRCFVGRGCASGQSCMSTTDCDDHVPCTTDLCVAGGTCSFVRNDSRCTNMQVCTSLGCVDRGRCGVDSDCDDGVYCNGVERCTGGRCMAGTAPDCADTDPCTGDVCNERTRGCDYPHLDPCGGSVVPGTYMLDMPPRYTCGAGGFGPVNAVTITLPTGGLQITGFPVVLMGSAPSGGMFTAAGSEPRGGCTWRYTFSGSFTGAGRFMGSWSLQFDDCVITLMCFAQSGFVTGTRM